MAGAPQPLHGLGHFLARPVLWLAPLVATLLGMAVSLVLALFVIWWQWPGQETEGWWSTTLAILWALGAGGITGVVGWFALLPILSSLAYEKLVRQIFRSLEVSIQEEKTFDSMRSSISVLLRTLPWTVGWMVLGLAIGWFFPPIGVWASQMALAHLTLLEASDVGLALRGLNGKQRWQWLQARHSSIIGSALVASVLGVGLGMTVIGWIIFVPTLFTASALWIAKQNATSDLSLSPSSSD